MTFEEYEKSIENIDFTTLSNRERVEKKFEMLMFIAVHLDEGFDGPPISQTIIELALDDVRNKMFACLRLVNELTTLRSIQQN